MNMHPFEGMAATLMYRCEEIKLMPFLFFKLASSFSVLRIQSRSNSISTELSI